MTETEKIKIRSGKNDQAVCVYVFITHGTLGCLREGNFFEFTIVKMKGSNKSFNC